MWHLSSGYEEDVHSQCWTGIVFFLYHSVICNDDFTFFDTSREWVFDGVCVCDTIWVYIPCKNLHT